MDAHEAFVAACRSGFDPLVNRFQFSGPEVESIGRECFVRFHKGPRTVSIAWEPGLSPIVELFYPAGPNDPVTAWAARGSVQYARRIPRLRPRIAYDATNAERALEYLRDSMRQLSEAEVAFLHG